MFDFFRKLFAPERSSETAKERLRLVLLSDHLSLAPDTVQALKADLLEVISRYVDIDAGNADVTFEHREHEVAMLASIPITGVRERTAPLAPAPETRAASLITPTEIHAAAAPGTAPSEPPPLRDQPSDSVLSDPDAGGANGHASPDATVEQAATVEGNVAPLPVRSGNAARPRRRRRKKHGVAAVEVRRATPGAADGGPDGSS